MKLKVCQIVRVRSSLKFRGLIPHPLVGQEALVLRNVGGDLWMLHAIGNEWAVREEHLDIVRDPFAEAVERISERKIGEVMEELKRDDPEFYTMVSELLRGLMAPSLVGDEGAALDILKGMRFR